jgi:hypothetical protein
MTGRSGSLLSVLALLSLPALLLSLLPACSNQHASGAVEVVDNDCVACHAAEAASVAEPPHAGNFPETCFECHSTAAWKPAAFTHDNLVSPCYACHRSDYQGAMDPPHVDRVPQTCEDCHTTSAWMPATFDHANVTGTCYSCHRLDYEGTDNPPHVQDGYPQTCNDCHTTDMWIPALDGLHPEDRFPIGDGPHQEFECLECHKTNLGSSTDGQNTDCVGCHTGEHARQKVDEKHQEVPEYLFDVNNPHFCLECHPNGRNE